MAGRPNPKWLETMIAKHGSREAVRAHMQQQGRKGGSVKGTKGGFAANVDCNCDLVPGDHYIRNCAGTVGGRTSKRTRRSNMEKAWVDQATSSKTSPSTSRLTEQSPKNDDGSSASGNRRRSFLGMFR